MCESQLWVVIFAPTMIRSIEAWCCSGYFSGAKRWLYKFSREMESTRGVTEVKNESYLGPKPKRRMSWLHSHLKAGPWQPRC